MQSAVRIGSRERTLKLALGSELGLLLLISAAKWLTYKIYASHQCIGRPLESRWKDAHFCVDGRELLIWHALDVALIGVAILLGITAVAAVAVSRTIRHQSVE